MLIKELLQYENFVDYILDNLYTAVFVKMAFILAQCTVNHMGVKIKILR